MHACIIIIYQCCVAILIQGIHIGSAHIMQDLSCTTSPCHLKTTLPYTTYSANLKLQAAPHSLLTATTMQSPSYLSRARCAANIHAQTCIHNHACMYNYNYAHAQKQVHAHTCMYNNYACTQKLVHAHTCMHNDNWVHTHKHSWMHNYNFMIMCTHKHACTYMHALQLCTHKSKCMHMHACIIIMHAHKHACTHIHNYNY